MAPNGKASVTPITREQQQQKLSQYRTASLPGDDAVFDGERGVFHFHGKHPSLVGVEAVVSVDLASLLLGMSVVLQTTVVPILTGQIAVKPAGKAD